MQLASMISDIIEQKDENMMADSSQSQDYVFASDTLFGPFKQPESLIDEIIEMTGAIPLFDKFDTIEVGALAAHMRITRLDEQQRLFSEGDNSDYMCFVVSGTLELLKESQNGRMVSVSTLSRGRLVGEMALVENFPRHATVIARTPCTLLKITRESFEHILEKRPGIGIAFLQTLSKSLSQNLRRTCGQLADVRESSSSVAAVSVLIDQKTSVKQPNFIDQIINRKQSGSSQLIRQLT
ncbi:cyclic nucleotide-binding protein [Mariprofundus ferrooxydans]|uniref:Cyclic nucleotide-binding protein n=2 Tax=Mariprofundus ferrooxydans TaxID=314344 RepID=Q0F204_9PROT|nr:cyclic nucleotide-binding protein [Mariprofundus ferrooxydans PV-1]KON47903.1 cyclic nucleotide-binding protein [Mariprofundus ferrooxydans]